MSWEETIAAIATPIGTGGIGIIRVSGDRAMEVAKALFHPSGKRSAKEQKSHSVRYGKIIDPKTRELLDEGLLLYMKAPHTFTGEDVVEFQCHGGTYLLRKVLQTILTQGVRLAEPGEFTKRAFLNGRIDLSQAESHHGYDQRADESDRCRQRRGGWKAAWEARYRSTGNGSWISSFYWKWRSIIRSMRSKKASS